jgi:hypothetical protein
MQNFIQTVTDGRKYDGNGRSEKLTYAKVS